MPRVHRAGDPGAAVLLPPGVQCVRAARDERAGGGRERPGRVRRRPEGDDRHLSGPGHGLGARPGGGVRHDEGPLRPQGRVELLQEQPVLCDGERGHLREAVLHHVQLGEWLAGACAQPHRAQAQAAAARVHREYGDAAGHAGQLEFV